MRDVILRFLSQIPAPVWFALGVFVLWCLHGLLDDLVAIARGRIPTPADLRKAGKTKKWKKASAEHVPVVSGSRASMASDPHARLLAPSFPNALCNDNPVNVLEVASVEDTRKMLEDSWEIMNRADLVTRLYRLLCGDHSKGYAALRSRCADPEWVERVLEDLDKTVDKSTMDVEMCWRIHRFLNNDRGIQDVEFAAWDLMRAAMLTRSGFALGWLSEDEAWDTLALINHALQMHYSSWDEAWEAYRLGRWLWAAEGPEEEAVDDMHDRARGAYLLGKRGLWKSLPWDAPIPESRFLLLDAVAAVGRLQVLSVSNWRKASAWERELDAQARWRTPLAMGGKTIVH